MNVSCNKCGKRYVIADEKVAGKASVKIRCKQCQNLISVAVVAPAPAPVEPLPDDGGGENNDEKTRVASFDNSAQWFAMVAGKQVGPFDLLSLGGKVRSGEVTLRTYLWKNGMGEWKRASDVPDVSQVFAGVTVGATATGPVQASAEARKPATSTAAALQRDVATANEVPSPQAPVVAKPEPAPAPAPRAAPLNDLFNDISGMHPQHTEEPQPSPEAAAATPGAEAPAPDAPAPGDPRADPGSPAYDPFAALSDPNDAQLPPPGEATRFFIAQAGVNKRNPPWKIALFIGGAIGLPVAAAYLLSSLHIVDLQVSRTTEDGVEVQEPFFSPGGITGLKDLLSGDAKKKKDEAERKAKEREALAARQRLAAQQARPAGDRGEKNPGADSRVETIDLGSTKTDPSLAAFYGEDVGKKGTVPRIRKDDGEGGQPVVNTGGGLSAEAIGKVVADKSKAFQACIDNALRRNPNLSVGSVTIVLSVSPSGAVKAAGVEPKKHEGSDWGQCMMATGKRIVFPSSDGETDVQLPFKIGVALSP